METKFEFAAAAPMTAFWRMTKRFVGKVMATLRV